MWMLYVSRSYQIIVIGLWEISWQTMERESIYGVTVNLLVCYKRGALYSVLCTTVNSVSAWTCHHLKRYKCYVTFTSLWYSLMWAYSTQCFFFCGEGYYFRSDKWFVNPNKVPRRCLAAAHSTCRKGPIYGHFSSDTLFCSSSRRQSAWREGTLVPSFLNMWQ